MSTRLDSIERCWRDDGYLDGRLVESLLTIARAAERLYNCHDDDRGFAEEALRRALEGTPEPEKEGA